MVHVKSSKRGQLGGGQGPPGVMAVELGISRQRLLAYLHPPNLGGLSNSSLQRGGEVGKGKADTTPPLRQTSANHRPSQERSLTLSGVLSLGFFQ